jgi:hypothetical protein
LWLPWLEKRLIYPDEDDDQLNKLQNLSDQVLTRSDLLQLLEAILAACCDYLQVTTAFAVSLNDSGPELIAAIGPTRPNITLLNDEVEALKEMLNIDEEDDELSIYKWHSYWIVPLHSKRRLELEEDGIFNGFIGVQARSPEVNLTLEEKEMFQSFAHRAAQTLDDLNLQTEIYAALEGLLPQIRITRTRAAQVEYRVGRNNQANVPTPGTSLMPTDEDREQFIEQVRAALRHYWGGPGLTHSRLLDLSSVHKALPENDHNPVRALRAVLTAAIESQRPEGERKMLSPEWTIYNILDLRFVEKLKVRDVATRLALSEPDLYRKQRIAIEAVADAILKME